MILGVVVTLVVNTCAGIYMFRRLTGCDDAACDDSDPPTGKRFVLKDIYVVHGILLILVPASVFLFLLIVLVKLICFILVDRKKARSNSTDRVFNGEKAYGQFDDESEDIEAIEAVVSVYFKIMDKVTFKTYKNAETGNYDDERNIGYMVAQDQCKLCLRYFDQYEELMKIPICDHIFHVHCLRKWLVDWQKCPTCEQNIIKLPEN